MEFFQGIGIVVFCLLICVIIFLGIFICTNCNVDDAFILYAIVISLIISGLIAAFVVTPSNFGYEQINTEITEREVDG